MCAYARICLRTHVCGDVRVRASVWGGGRVHVGVCVHVCVSARMQNVVGV